LAAKWGGLLAASFSMLSIEIQASKFRRFLEQFPKNQSHFVIFGYNWCAPRNINNIQQLSIEIHRGYEVLPVQASTRKVPCR